jgi:integrase
VTRRGPHEGAIYQRADGLWVGALHLGWEGGSRRRKVVYARTRRDVQEKLASAQHDISAGLAIGGRAQKVGPFLATWLEDVARPTVRPRTYRSYEQIVRVHLSPAIGAVPLVKLTAQQVQALLNTKTRTGLSPRTVHIVRDVLRNALGVALKWGLVTRNVAMLVDVPHVTRRELVVFNQEQARQFLAHIRGDRLEALYTVALALGLRQGEALALRWDDLDLDSAVLRVRHSLLRVGGRRELVEPKTALSRRSMPLPPIAVASLREHRLRQLEERLLAGSRWHDEGFVFATTVGTPLDGPTVTRRFQKALVGAGLPRQRFHDLRHGCASLLLGQGVPPRVVMELLGHSDVRLTQNVYMHVAPELQAAAVGQMQAVLEA